MYYRAQHGDGARLPMLPARDEFIAIEIRDILDRLPADYRAALEYRDVLGLSGSEAAAAMERSDREA